MRLRAGTRELERSPRIASAIYSGYTPMYSAVMSVPLTLLGLLEREPSHGYDLKRDYDAYFGRGKPLPFGQVYATLGRLARDGKVVVGEAEPGAGPGPQALRHHRAGRRARSRPGCAEPVEPEPHLQTVLFAKVVLALMLGPVGRAVPRRPARRAPAADARADRAASAPAALVDALLADHGLFHLEADLRWIDLTAARLDALADGGAADDRRRTAAAADRGPRRPAVVRPDAGAARRDRRGRRRARSSP